MAVDLSNKTIELLFYQQILQLTKDSTRKMRSFDRQFTVGMEA